MGLFLLFLAFGVIKEVKTGNRRLGLRQCCFQTQRKRKEQYESQPHTYKNSPVTNCPWNISPTVYFTGKYEKTIHLPWILSSSKNVILLVCLKYIKICCSLGGFVSMHLKSEKKQKRPLKWIHFIWCPLLLVWSRQLHKFMVDFSASSCNGPSKCFRFSFPLKMAENVLPPLLLWLLLFPD